MPQRLTGLGGVDLTVLLQGVHTGGAERQGARFPSEAYAAEYLLADKGYGSDALAELLKKSGIQPVISPRKSRNILMSYDKHIYHLRHLVEKAFLELKR